MCQPDRLPLSTSELRATPREIAGYHWEIVARSAALGLFLLMCHGGVLPAWTIALASFILYPGVYLRVHDIGHAVAPRRYGWSARFVPLSNPIWGGTRVFSVIHREHHTYLGTSKDPWLPYYAGHPLRALFFNFVEPEYSFAAFVRRCGVDRELAVNVLLNLAAMAIGLAVLQGLYVVQLASQRIVHMLGIFFFNFYTHRASLSADAPIGAWDREQDLGRLLPLLRMIWGRDLVDGLIYHNRHHCLRQMHVPVRHYKNLTDTGCFTKFNDRWPIPQIKRL